MKQAWLMGIMAGAMAAGTASATAQSERRGSRMAPDVFAQTATAGTSVGSISLGSIRLVRKAMADGKPLAAGSYHVRLTTDEARPIVAGQLPALNRWVEFLQGGRVVGREVVSIVPASEIGSVSDGARPRPGASRVELLKGNDYLRIWMNRQGTHYLIHLRLG